MSDLPTQLSKNLIIRLLLIIVGSIAVVLGFIGIFVPGLPTVPFLLLAAACYARSSQRFYHWLLNNRPLGPIICQWRENQTISRRNKTWAILSTMLSFGVTIIFFIPSPWVQLGLTLAALVLVSIIMRLPTEVVSDRNQS
ncbi:MAG: YbaN family protein [Gammaproteobacteria bacterium]|nr:YbaN family protein [Gammaproteobacteria bacterium]MDH5730531.1 YbaN family protein [Gammaproteobacteria bacterium]